MELGTLPAASLRAGAGVTTAADRDDFLIYNTSNGALYYDANGVGGAAAVQIATLPGQPALSNTEFSIV